MYNRYYQDHNKNINIYKNNYNNISKSNSVVPETDKTEIFGFLEVNVSANDGTPIQNAVVTVFILDRFAGEAAVQIATTDSNGKAPTLTIPTAYYLGEEIGPDYYFTAYNLRVDALGYYSSQTNNVRFYPGITTVFNTALYPTPISIPGINLEQRIQLPPPTPNE
ncbi:MAG: hypothetical protein K0Q97_246 [Bacillota bacterium]|nr:hypothetical protein [Bacillota bacterium]